MGEKLGQHFLHSESVLANMVSAAELTRKDTVLEIGPGRGGLTKKLLKVAKMVVAVEKDSELFRFLQKKFSNEISSEKLFLVNTDIRDFNPSLQERLPNKYKLVANIPYYITGEILRTYLSNKKYPVDIVFLIQKEVAERIVAKDKKESLLSISVKAYGNPVYVRTVKRGSFDPPPKVDSAILKIENISRDKFQKVTESDFFEIVRAGFAHKRKQLAGNLSDYEKRLVITALKELGLPVDIRAEKLSLDGWFELIKKLDERIPNNRSNKSLPRDRNTRDPDINITNRR